MHIQTYTYIFALKKARASGRNVGKVFNPVVKLVLENYPFSYTYCVKYTYIQTYFSPTRRCSGCNYGAAAPCLEASEQSSALDLACTASGTDFATTCKMAAGLL